MFQATRSKTRTQRAQSFWNFVSVSITCLIPPFLFCSSVFPLPLLPSENCCGTKSIWFPLMSRLVPFAPGVLVGYLSFFWSPDWSSALVHPIGILWFSHNWCASWFTRWYPLLLQMFFCTKSTTADGTADAQITRAVREGAAVQDARVMEGDDDELRMILLWCWGDVGIMLG